MAIIHYTFHVNGDAQDPRFALVYGPDNMTPRVPPRVVLGDTMQLDLVVLNSDGTVSDASGNQDYIVKAAIGTYTGGMLTYSDDFLGTGSSWTGSLSLATIELSNFLAGRDSANAVFELELTNLGAYSSSHATVLSTPIIVNNQVIAGAFLSSGSMPEYLSVSESDSRYILRTEFLSASGWVPLDPNIVWTSRYVGIGSSTPSKPLHVVGDGLFTGNLTASLILGNLVGTASAAANEGAGWYKSGSVTYTTQKVSIGVADSPATYGADFLVRDAGGNIVFRMDAPNGLAQFLLASRGFPLEPIYFDFMHGNNAAARIFVKNEDFSLYNNVVNTGSIRFHTNTASVDTERMRITNIGDVGIGTPTPQAKLHVQGDISASNFRGYLMGTASIAENYPLTTSYSDRSGTASYCDFAATTGTVLTASYSYFAELTNNVLYAQDCMSASYAKTASFCEVALYALSGTFTTTNVVSNSFASSSLTASLANTASWALTASRALSCETASAAYAGIGGFDARGQMVATSVSTSVLTGIISLQNPTTTMMAFGSSSANILTTLNLMQSNPFGWLGFPNLLFVPAVSPQPDYGWLKLYQGYYSQSYERFRGLKIDGADLWCNSITCSNAFLMLTSSQLIVGTSSMAISSSHAQTASYVRNAVSASYSTVTDNINIAKDNSLDRHFLTFAPFDGLYTGPNGLMVGSASFQPGTNTIFSTASHARYSDNNKSSSYALSASYALNAGTGGAVITSGSSWNITSSVSTSSSFALTASYAISASYEINIETSSSHSDSASVATSASYALSCSYALNAGQSVIQSGSTWNITASNAVSTSYSVSSSYALVAMTAVSSSYTQTIVHVTSSFQPTASYFYDTYSTGSWNMYVNKSTGDLIFKWL